MASDARLPSTHPFGRPYPGASRIGRPVLSSLSSVARSAVSQPHYLVFVDSSSITWLSTLPPLDRGRAPSLHRRYPASSVLQVPPPSASADNLPRGFAVGSKCRSSPRTQTSLVAYRSFPVRAAITTPVDLQIALLVHFLCSVGLRRYYGGSASTLELSGPAPCSLALRPARTADLPRRPFPEVLQTIRCLLIRFRCFRLERELAGPDLHRGEPYTFQDTHNNAAEREMKRIVLNRKNSLFVGNERGGRTAAILASLTSTCRRHEIDPQLYLTQLLVNLPGLPHRQLSAWLPDRWKQGQRAGQTGKAPF